MRRSYLLDRLLALIYDLIFLGLSILVSSLCFNYLNDRFFRFGQVGCYLSIGLIGFCLYLIEFTIIPLLIKGTIGKYLTELEIVATKGKITFGRLLFRELFLKHLFYLTGIGFVVDIVFYLFKKQTIHDFLLKTKVIRKEILE